MKWVRHGYRRLIDKKHQKFYVAVFKLALAPVFRALRPRFDTATEAVNYGKRVEARILRFIKDKNENVSTE